MFTALFFKSPLQNRILILFMLLAAVPPLLLGGLTLFFLDLTHRHDVVLIQQEALEASQRELNTFFSEVTGVLEIRLEAIESEFQNLDKESRWQERLAEALLEEYPFFTEIVFVVPEGKEIARASRSTRIGPLLYVSELPLFLQAWDGTVAVGDVYYTEQGPRMAVAAPIWNGSQVVQVVIAEVDISSVIKSVEVRRISESGYFLLFDKRGRLLGTHSYGDIVRGDDIPWRRHVPDTLVARRYESIFSNEAVSGMRSDIANIGWFLLAEWPLREADMVLNGVRRQIAIVIAASVLIVMMIAPVVALRIVRPIRILEAGAQSIEQGNFSPDISITTGDELEELGGAFNRMAQGLKRLQELKNEFVFIAAHELRTPVTAIKGYLSMILEGTAGALTDKMKQLITPVWSSNERLVQLVDDLLEIARSEAGRLDIKVAPHDLRENIRAVLREIKPLADKKHISLFYDEPQSLPMVALDPTRVTEVVMNFVSNAIKYNNEGGQIKIYHEIQKNMVVTHVEDNGFGMSPEDKKRLFEKFFRADAAKEKNIQGTGLGLFITKELVEKMHGSLEVTSTLGKGSRFSFSLPEAST